MPWQCHFPNITPALKRSPFNPMPKQRTKEKMHVARMFNTSRRGAKTVMKSLYHIPKSHKMSDEEYNDLQGFIIGTMSESGWETKSYERDFSPFMKMLMKGWTTCRKWSILKAKYDNDKMWPILKTNNDGTECVIAFCKEGTRKTDWHNFTKEFVQNEFKPNSGAVETN